MSLIQLKADLERVRREKHDLECAEALLMLLICHHENPDKAKRVSRAIDALLSPPVTCGSAA